MANCLIYRIDPLHIHTHVTILFKFKLSCFSVSLILKYLLLFITQILNIVSYVSFPNFTLVFF